MNYETISLEREGALARLTMNRPEALNALSGQTLMELADALECIERETALRAVIISGAGNAFVAGADIAYMQSLTPQQARVFSRDTNAIYARMAASGKVYIAAVNGFALGGGCELALACDLCIASEYAKFGLPEVGLGILPGGGGTQRLARLVGPQRAKELILTGRTIHAQEALALGMVLSVVPAGELSEKAAELAEQILKNSPAAVSYAKECVQKSQELGLHSGVELENLLFGLCFAAPDQQEGMSAFLAKREPDYFAAALKSGSGHHPKDFIITVGGF